MYYWIHLLPFGLIGLLRPSRLTNKLPFFSVQRQISKTEITSHHLHHFLWHLLTSFSIFSTVIFPQNSILLLHSAVNFGSSKHSNNFQYVPTTAVSRSLFFLRLHSPNYIILHWAIRFPQHRPHVNVIIIIALIIVLYTYMASREHNILLFIFIEIWKTIVCQISWKRLCKSFGNASLSQIFLRRLYCYIRGTMYHNNIYWA